jgi:C4-dicarboxylate-specific signal transduction histidine kinase
VLARLDQDLAPLRSSVDREGNLLRLDGPADAADVADRVVDIVEQMGYVAEGLEKTPAVPRWFGAEEADELSQEEAIVLAERWAEGLAAEGVIADAKLLVESLRAVLIEAFRSAARTGDVVMPRIGEEAFRAVLGENQAKEVRRWIERKLLGPHPE